MLARSSTRVRTPTVLQMEATECGAAALAIILAHHGRYVPLEELRMVCGVSRDGSKAVNIVKGARTYGLVASGKRFDVSDLKRQQLPFIVFWNFNHFLVVEGFAAGVVYLNDPASGPRRVTDDEFSKAYTGITLVFEPGPDFKTGGERPSLAKALLPRLRGSGAALGFVLLASLALVVPGIVAPVFTQVFVDSYLVERLDDWIKPLLLGMAITALLRAALTWLQQSQLLRLEMRLAISGSGAFFWHVLRLPVEFFNQRYAGDISQRVASNDRIANILAGGLATNAANVIALVFFAAIMVQYDWQLTLVGVLITGANLVALKYISRLRKDGNMRLLQDRGKLVATTMGGIQTIETIKASGGEADFFARWSGFKAKVNNAEQQLELYTRLLAVLPNLLNALVTVAILGLGGSRVMAGDMSVGMLVAFQSLMTSFTQPVTNLMGLAARLQEAEGDMARVHDVMKYPLDPSVSSPAPPAASGVRIPQGHLQLKHVTFGYSTLEPPLLEDFNLDLKPGCRIALVGGSGSGKSTIARLVMGICQPWSGEVTLDGVPKDRLPAGLWGAALGGVDQEAYLFEGTVRENLSLWDTTLPEADMVRAARDACIHDAIAARPGGYESKVKEGGSNFSGGEAQRMEIARALTTNPRTLVLDEATSALDPSTEKAIEDGIRQRGCACLVVAHRLSTIRDCDEIIVLERGKVVERGTHEVLMGLDGAYRKLIEAVQ